MGEAKRTAEVASGVGEPCCANCLFAAPSKAQGRIHCKRVPPIASPVLVPGAIQGQVNVRFVAGFPEISAAEWCGEHVPRDAAVLAAASKTGAFEVKGPLKLDIPGETSDE